MTDRIYNKIPKILYLLIHFIASQVRNLVIKRGSHRDWKTWENGRPFSSQGKSGNFNQTGKVREFYPKY